MVASCERAVVLKNEKQVILAFRLVAALVALAFFFTLPPGVKMPWQFYFVMAVFLLSNLVFFLEGVESFDSRRAQIYIFLFDVGMLTVLMVFMGMTNKEFYVVFLLTIFISALSKRLVHAFVITLAMSLLYAFFALSGPGADEIEIGALMVRMVLFFVVSSFVGHISETAERGRVDVQKLTEWKAKAESLAMEQEKRAVVGLLAAGVAHEFNNLLAGIQGYADLADMGAMTHEDAVKTIGRDCRRASALVKDLVAFSNKRAGHFCEVNIKEAAEHAMRMVRPEAEARGVEIGLAGGDGLSAMMEEGALERTILSVVSNALQAVPDGGRVTLEAFESPEGPALRISDNGPGMDERVLAHAFDPFFSARETASKEAVSRAGGLGLAVSKRLMERSGGRIGIESAPGEGTVVTVTCARTGRETT